MVANLPQPCFANAPPVSPLLARSAIKIVLGWRYALTQTLTTTFIRSRKIKSLIMTWHSIKAIPLHLFWTFSCKSWHNFWYLLKTAPRWQFTKLHCMWIFSGFDNCLYSIQTFLALLAIYSSNSIPLKRLHVATKKTISAFCCLLLPLAM